MTTSPAACRPPWGGRCSQSGAEWYEGGRRERGRGEEGKEEVENNRERATGVETGRNKQKSKMSMYAKENRRIIGRYRKNDDVFALSVRS